MAMTAKRAKARDGAKSGVPKRVREPRVVIGRSGEGGGRTGNGEDGLRAQEGKDGLSGGRAGANAANSGRERGPAPPLPVPIASFTI